ncbi:roadblock/LC7 domain-containing protein [Kineococcus terrestris]|uniref:roadblock/LC7 domain-containing protein n=1 Tax=Kineococcus terrestris TaxID=2044856 RepID=UPI0034DB5AF9
MSDVLQVEDLDWLMAGFKKRVPGVLHAIAVTADGFHLASTPGLPEAARRQLCPVTCGLASLATGLSGQLGKGSCRRLVIDTERGRLVVASISDGSALTVLVNHRADLGQLGYEVDLLVARVGQALTPETRSALAAGGGR